LEIGRRIVESEMPIFTDADERNIDGSLKDGFAGEPDDLGGIRVALHQMTIGDSCFANQTFPEIFAEARRVIHRQVDIFVQMKELHALPIDAGSCGQRLKERNCDAPVAATMRARPRRAIAVRIAAAA
jgi:hypothetical protein